MQTSTHRSTDSRSTGPRTPEGKAISRENAVRHALAGYSFRLLDGESEEIYQGLLSALTADHQPVGQTEVILVVRLAQSHWLAQRALRLSVEALEADNQKKFALMARYHTTHERAFNATVKQLDAMQQKRQALARNEPELALAERITIQNGKTIRNHAAMLKFDHPPQLLTRSQFAAPAQPPVESPSEAA
jgi:hypothetical protein